MIDWLNDIVDRLVYRHTVKGEPIVCNGGLSVSGLQHVGRLRGEVTYVNSVVRELKKRGIETVHTIVLYVLDAWKGKEAQIKQFKHDGEEFRGRPLDEVPDPFECHNNWVEHFWEDFGGYLEEFAPDVQIVTTRELYKENERMRKFVLMTLTTKREDVIRTINKYRKRRPYPTDFIPFQPICSKCRRIDSTTAVKLNETSKTIEYVCRYCGNRGTSSIEEGKLTWRLEWVGIWYALNVSFEPYGKDHATPGGSRDSCNDLAKNVYGFNPPEGIAYEWVGYKVGNIDMGDMGSSDFIGFTPKEWLEVAEPEVLKYLYLSTDPMKRIVLSMQEIPRYHDKFDLAEKVFYGLKTTVNKELVKKCYELSLNRPPFEECPFRISYLQATVLAQLMPPECDVVDFIVNRLKSTKVINRDLKDYEIELITNRVLRASKWVDKYAPRSYILSISETVDEHIISSISQVQRRLLRNLLKNLKEIKVWTEDEIKNAMMSIKRTKEEERLFFKALYLIFFGREYGPRIAPYLSMLSRDFVIKRIEEVLK